MFARPFEMYHREWIQGFVPTLIEKVKEKYEHALNFPADLPLLVGNNKYDHKILRTTFRWHAVFDCFRNNVFSGAGKSYNVKLKMLTGWEKKQVLRHALLTL